MQSDDDTETAFAGLEHTRATLSGVVAIPVTPFAEDGSVDWDRHAALLQRLVSAGVGAVTPNGNTGEFYTLTPAEARRAAENTVKEVGERATVIVGVGLDTAGAVAAAAHARDCGANLVMVHQPVHPYISGEGWTEYHRTVADAVPELGVVLYVRDARITGEQIAQLGELCPNVVGVKYSVADPVRFASVAQDAGRERFVWLAGLAELSAPGYFALGATGFTSGLANVAPEIALEMYRLLAAGDYHGALEIWDLIRPFEQLRAADSSADNVSVVKEALAQLGLSRRDVRPPSRTLPTAVRGHIESILADWGARWQL
ncbi:MAG TPA: dihydrodipicolinate synthase family protein [Actinocrinis sp.]|jgi:4-hydroxy-tetrahydrodipicolinate synthase|uniref:dihydrodipicolinate synthase family protein n=1 Tax=Actinocrinis sp. TaxID=1920516 RepID=UPI002DDCD28A|nr:dihydrodipicolinate synthase family protein [Actinocrinis sp.]HEV3171064.1 dihydrodipicolinate synthase family protein [Actinocrinis sp.]